MPLEFKNQNISKAKQEIEKYQIDKKKGSTDNKSKHIDQDSKVYDVEIINQTGTSLTLPRQIVL